MSVFVLAFVAVAVASFVGTLVALIVAGIPLDVLARAARGGRYAGLAAGDRTSPVGPSAGHLVTAFASWGAAA